VIVEPVFATGAVKATDRDVFAGVIVPRVGALGARSGVIEADALDAADVPAAFVAVTVNV
jgi:hypothetical protein